jgi:hypothetical protein
VDRQRLDERADLVVSADADEVDLVGHGLYSIQPSRPNAHPWR